MSRSKKWTGRRSAWARALAKLIAISLLPLPASPKKTKLCRVPSSQGPSGSPVCPFILRTSLVSKSLFKIWRNARQAQIFSLGKAI